MRPVQTIEASDLPSYQFCSACGNRLVPVKGNVTFDRATGERQPLDAIGCPQGHEMFLIEDAPKTA